MSSNTPSRATLIRILKAIAADQDWNARESTVEAIRSAELATYDPYDTPKWQLTNAGRSMLGIAQVLPGRPNVRINVRPDMRTLPDGSRVCSLGRGLHCHDCDVDCPNDAPEIVRCACCGKSTEVPQRGRMPSGWFGTSDKRRPVLDQCVRVCSETCLATVRAAIAEREETMATKTNEAAEPRIGMIQSVRLTIDQLASMLLRAGVQIGEGATMRVSRKSSTKSGASIESLEISWPVSDAKDD